MPMSLVGELVSIGTLLAFVLVCVGVPLLRVANPTIERPFKVPGGMAGAWIVGIAGRARRASTSCGACRTTRGCG